MILMNHVEQLLKKKELLCQVFVRYSSHQCSNFAQMIPLFFFSLFLSESISKKWILEIFKYLASTIYLFLKKQ